MQLALSLVQERCEQVGLSDDHCFMVMPACNWKDLGITTESCVLDIHFCRETHSDIFCRTVVEKMTQSSVNHKIGRLNHLACICVTGTLRLTPTSALEVLLVMPPLNIFIEKECR
jgi:hypothetical protein